MDECIEKFLKHAEDFEEEMKAGIAETEKSILEVRKRIEETALDPCHHDEIGGRTVCGIPRKEVVMDE